LYSSILMMIVSLIFYCWAIANVIMEHRFDLGIACFFISFSAGITGVYAALERTSSYVVVYACSLSFGVFGVVASYVSTFFLKHHRCSDCNVAMLVLKWLGPAVGWSIYGVLGLMWAVKYRQNLIQLESSRSHSLRPSASELN